MGSEYKRPPVSSEIENKRTTLAHNNELVRSLEPFVKQNLLLLIPPEKLWQPTDLLPVDFSLPKDVWTEQIDRVQERAQRLSIETIFTLIGNTITEEGLPLYMSTLVKSEAFGDRTGTDDAAWARWARGWTAEEKRHGDLLMSFLQFTGRVNIRAIHMTTQSFIRNGFGINDDADPLQSIVYTTVQEKATNVSHNNQGRLAKEQGDDVLAKICQHIASDENRHFTFYNNVFGEALRLDPDAAMIALYKLMKKKVVMPGRLMDDGVSKDANGKPNIFELFSVVAENIGIYTHTDYANIFGGILKDWDIEHRIVSGEGARAQEKVIELQMTHAKVAERAEVRKREKGAQKSPDLSSLSWLQTGTKLSHSGIIFESNA